MLHDKMGDFHCLHFRAAASKGLLLTAPGLPLAPIPTDTDTNMNQGPPSVGIDSDDSMNIEERSIDYGPGRRVRTSYSTDIY